MTAYNQNTFRELIFSNDPDKIDEGMELLKSTHPQTLEDVYTEIGWEFEEHLWLDYLNEHAYLSIYLLGVLFDFEVPWVRECKEYGFTQSELSRLPDNLSKLTHMTKLDLSWNNLTSLPDCWVHLI